MKSYLRLFFAAIFGLFLSTVAFAQVVSAQPVASGLTADTVVQWLTPVLVPLLIAGFKKFAPAIPSWSLPVIAPVLGVLIDLVNSYALGHSTNLLLAAALGLAGVGMRELKENLKPAQNAGWSDPAK